MHWIDPLLSDENKEMQKRYVVKRHFAKNSSARVTFLWEITIHQGILKKPDFMIKN